MVSGSFHSLLRVLFTFPLQYWFTIGLSVVFSLTRWCRHIQTEFLRFRPTQDSTIISFRIRDYHPLRSSFPSFLFPYSLQPHISFWAPPLSLATTYGITIVFFSSGYLDVSVLRVILPRVGYRSSTCRVAPFGHLRINVRLQLPVAFRSLPRPSSSLRAKASTIRPYSLPNLTLKRRYSSHTFRYGYLVTT
jgi:hypothetical protein